MEIDIQDMIDKGYDKQDILKKISYDWIFNKET